MLQNIYLYIWIAFTKHDHDYHYPHLEKEVKLESQYKHGVYCMLLLVVPLVSTVSIILQRQIVVSSSQPCSGMAWPWSLRPPSCAGITRCNGAVGHDGSLVGEIYGTFVCLKLFG